MQKLFLALTVLMLTFVSYAQQEDYQLGISKQFHPNDTTRTFTITQGDLEQVKGIFTRTFGNPQGTGGIIVWEKIKIPGIKQKLRLILHDGVMTKEEDGFSICYTSDEKNNKEKIANLGKGQSRYMNIKILDMQGEEIINSDQLETLINEYLLQILNKK